MLIKKLIVRKTQPSIEIIREIDFKLNGLNLIVDNTAELKTDTGNSVGKSTVIKIIDLCLGAKTVNQLFFDTDTNSTNFEIKDFLIQYKVQAELILTNKEQTQIYKLVRDLYPKGKRYIDDVSFKEKEFSSELKKILFNSEENEPTFRKLIPKFVRLTNVSEESMIKYLHTNTKPEDYEAIYSFLFRISDTDLISQKSEINDQISNCKKTISALEKSKSISSISALNQKLNLIEANLNELNQQRKNLSILDSYKDELETKRNITSKIDKTQNELQFLEYEIALMEQSNEELRNEKSNINVDLLAQIYSEAQSYVPILQKKFEEVVSFHNAMIQNRIEFIKNSLKQKILKRDILMEKQEELLKEKEQLTMDILDEGLLDDLNNLSQKIEELILQKGEINQSLRILEEQNQLLNNLSLNLQNVEKKVSSSNIDKVMTEFNNIFSSYCKKLYGMNYLINYNCTWKKDKKKFPVTIEILDGNVGTGKKKALIAAFDLAYLEFANLKSIRCPQFVIHDKMETIHVNQLATIVEICKSIHGQYILPILRERIKDVKDNYVDESIVLELSSDDKFFRI